MERGTTRPAFWDVDTLYDFMRSDGKPDVPGSEEIVPPHGMRGTAGQREIVQTALVDPLVIEPELEDGNALGRRNPAHHGDFLLTTRSMSSPTPMCRHCSQRWRRSRSWHDVATDFWAGRRVIHATAGTFWRPILLS